MATSENGNTRAGSFIPLVFISQATQALSPSMGEALAVGTWLSRKLPVLHDQRCGNNDMRTQEGIPIVHGTPCSMVAWLVCVNAPFPVSPVELYITGALAYGKGLTCLVFHEKQKGLDCSKVPNYEDSSALAESFASLCGKCQITCHLGGHIFCSFPSSYNGRLMNIY